MKTITDKIKEYYDATPNNKEALWRSFRRMDEALEGIDAEVSDKLRRAIHEDFCGPHYNDYFAKEDVAGMYHKDAKGEKVSGELVPMSKATEVFNANKAHIRGEKYNVYDMYVALNASMHDLGELFAKVDGERTHEMLVQYVLVFWFDDSDAPDGKIWLYMRAM